MKKIVLFIIAAVMGMAGVSAQNAFFPTKEGMKVLYINKNAKGQVEGYTRQTVRKVVKSGDNLTVNYSGQTLDKNGKASDKSPEVNYTVNIRNGVVEMDMKTFATLGAEASIEIKGDKLIIPSGISVGQKLPDAHCTLTITTIVSLKMEMSFTEQECIAVENLTVPAGTFKSTEISRLTSTKAMGHNTVSKTLTWYAPGIGVVKSETYDSKGKLGSVVELKSIEN